MAETSCWTYLLKLIDNKKVIPVMVDGLYWVTAHGDSEPQPRLLYPWLAAQFAAQQQQELVEKSFARAELINSPVPYANIECIWHASFFSLTFSIS